MQRRTNMLSTVVLSAVMLCGATAIAADVPKEGPFTFSYLGRGSFVASFAVKDQTFGIWDNHTNYSANGLFDHGSARCLGTEIIRVARDRCSDSAWWRIRPGTKSRFSCPRLTSQSANPLAFPSRFLPVPANMRVSRGAVHVPIKVLATTPKPRGPL